MHDVDAPATTTLAPGDQPPGNLTSVRAKTAPAAFLRGEIVAGRFEILRPLGQGGMGQVFAAADLELGGTLALKVVRPDLAVRPEVVAQLRREVRLARMVTHPNVCRIYDVTQHDDLLLLTMELLDGRTLQERLLEDGPLAVSDALQLLRQMASALESAHRVGVVHRDLKPGNVMLLDEGDDVRAVVTDFGVAGLWSTDGDDPSRHAETEPRVAGTPAYMAPEERLGSSSPAGDLFSLGVVAFECLTGRRPSLKTPTESIDAHGLDPEIETLLVHCLAIDPAKRPTPAALLECLDRLVDPVVQGVDVLVQLSPVDAERGAASVAGLEAIVREHGGRVLSTRGQDLLAAMNVPSDTLPLALQLTRLEGRRRLIGSLTWLSDQRTLVAGAADGGIEIWQLGGSTEPRRSDAHDAQVNALAAATDGGKFASASKDDTIGLWTEDGLLHGRLVGHRDSVIGVAFHPQGTYLISGSRDGTMLRWPLASDPVRRSSESQEFEDVLDVEPETLLNGLGILRDVAIGFEPPTFAALLDNGRIEIYRWPDGMDSGSRATLEISDRNDNVILALDPRASILYSGRIDGSIASWRLDPGGVSLLHEVAAHGDRITTLAVGCTGSRLISGSWDGTARAWTPDLDPTSTLLEVPNAQITSAVCDPDSDLAMIGTSSGRIQLWHLDEPDPMATLRNSTQVCLAPDFRQTVLGESNATAMREWRACEAQPASLPSRSPSRKEPTFGN